MRIYVSMMMLCIILTACVSTATTKTQESKIVHIVLVWLKEPSNQEHIQQVIDISNRLNEIPDIQELRVGKSIPSERKIVDDSFDLGLYIIFENQASMQRYLDHPEHKNAVKTVLMPLASKVLVYDFEDLGK